MTIDTKKLRGLAEAATPGPWIKAGPWPHVVIWRPTGDVDPETDSDTTEPDHVCDVFRSSMNEHGEWLLPGDDVDATADFIAAANPQTVIALLDDNERLTQQLAAANAEIERLREDMGRSSEEDLERLLHDAVDTRGEISRLHGCLARLRHSCRNAVAGLDADGQAHMGLACRQAESQCFCGMHVCEVDSGRPGVGGAFGQLDFVHKQLAAMTKARDEACGIARALVRSTDDRTSWLEMERIDALEKVGQ